VVVTVGVVVSVFARVTLADPPPEVTFTRIADTDTLVPYGKWKGERFTGFGVPGTDNGNVVFVAGAESSTSESENGVFKWENGELGLVADPSTPRPGSAIPFRQFVAPSVCGDQYAFGVSGFVPDQSAVYRTVGGELAQQAIIAPVHPRRVMLDGAVVWFSGITYRVGQPPRLGVYRANAGSVTTVASDGQPNPATAAGYTFAFDSKLGDYPAVAKDGAAVFWAPSRAADSVGPPIHGLYKYHDGNIQTIAESTMAQFNGGIDRNAFDYDGATVAFAAAGTVFIARGGAFEPIATDGQPAPDGGTFALQNPLNQMAVSADGGRVAFTSVLASPPLFLDYSSGIYSDVAGSLRRIIGTGDTLGDQLVYSIVISPDALSGNQIAFWARFTDGTTGVYVATVPEPAACVIAYLWLIGTLARMRRRYGKQASDKPDQVTRKAATACPDFRL
jgi:hypothetical protein